MPRIHGKELRGGGYVPGGSPRHEPNLTDEMPAWQKEFVDWLVTPPADRVPRTQGEFAAQHGLHPGSVSNVKRERRFQNAVNDRCSEVNLAPDRVQEVINALFYAATVEHDVKAMSLYLQHADRLSPKRVVIEDKRTESMTDDELRDEIAALGMIG